MSAAQPFWISKSLQEMSESEWEAVCDGCGLCCLNKLEDEDTGEVYYTDVACRLLDLQSCRCQDYRHRLEQVPGCLSLSYDNMEDVDWLPETCGYRLLAEGKPLFDWHPLVSGREDSVHHAGISVQGRCISETSVSEEEIEERIVYWVS
ncbi:hypothetical protein TDB9533_04381 [Thalassocella blandensis]|nr:hypothetical protein TDB9533_04381 [Thalassocella blandensis]